MNCRLIQYISLLLLILFLTSCGSSNHVVSKGPFQKRKYNKGWYVNLSNKKGFSKKEDQKETTAEKTDIEVPQTELHDEYTLNQVEVEEIVFELELQSLNVKKSQPHDVQPDPIELPKLEYPTISKKELIQKGAEVILDEEPIDYLAEAKKQYKTSWMFTVLAILSISASLILLLAGHMSVHLFGGIALLVLAFALYILMFIYLVKAGNSLAFHDALDGSSVGSIRFFIYAHIIIGSLVAILLFFVPLITCFAIIGKTRKSLKSENDKN